MKRELKSLTREELLGGWAALAQPTYRADQILSWAYGKCAASFEAMKNLPIPLRAQLAEQFELNSVRELREQRSTDTTEKFLFALSDQSLIETVLIPATPGLCSRADRRTVCVSTQVGCAFGCQFCASGLEGMRRNLTAGEIVDQVVAVQRWMWKNPKLPPSNPQPQHSFLPSQSNRPALRRITNIVVMGMGEPLANYDNLMRALRILNAPWGMNIGARKITVSTVGLVPRIQQLAQEPLPLRLAVSLHAPTDELRDRIMPVNRRWPLKELLAACEVYAKTPGRRLTFEYTLIEDLNDAPEQAEKLATIARRVHAKVNLIPYNTVAGLPWRRPAKPRCTAFAHRLRSLGVHATLRLEKGHDIAAACGQLRLQQERPAE